MARDGLQRVRWMDSIDDFVRQHGHHTPRWAIVLTYCLDLDRFVRTVQPCLDRRGKRFRTVVLADQGALEQALQRHRARRPTMNLHPVRSLRGGVFHPKLVFLRAGTHVRVCFGSANVTDGGLGSNLELWANTESPEVVGGVVDFLRKLTSTPHLAVDDAARRSIGRATTGLAARPTPLVWSSLDGTFKARVATERGVKRTAVISPMFAKPGGLSDARDALPDAPLELFTSEPVKLSRVTVRVYQPDPTASADDEPPPMALHAKAYLFWRAQAAAVTAWIGSANFTARALATPLDKGGNVELLVRTTLPQDEARALEHDLKEMFVPAEDAGAVVPPRDDEIPRPGSTVLSCELIQTTSGARLVVRGLNQRDTVVLASDGRRVRVAIRKGRGVVEGHALARFLPGVDTSAPQVIVVHQVLGGRELPVVVNVAHVPPAEEVGVSTQASLNALLDDLLGRIPVARGGGDDGDEDDPDDRDDDEDDDEDDALDDELERKLDEVKHEGELDQLAVKAALLRKLATRTGRSGSGRDAWLTEALTTLLRAAPPHLHQAIKRVFTMKKPGGTP